MGALTLPVFNQTFSSIVDRISANSSLYGSI